MNEYGTFSWFGFSLPMVERARLLHDAGYAAVMLWWGDEFRDYDGPKEEHPDIFRRANIRVENVHLPYYGINALWTDTIDGAEQLSRLLSCIDTCGAADIPVAVLHLTESDNAPAPNALGLDRLHRLVARAKERNVILAAENLYNAIHLDFAFEQISSSALSFCFDSGHAHCCGLNEKFLTRYDRPIAALHLHDNDGKSDQHRLPFNGSVDWPLIMQTLRARGYNGALTLEVDASFTDFRTDGTDWTAETYLAEGINRLRRLAEM